MKNLILLILLLPLFAKAQVNGSIQRTAATGVTRYYNSGAAGIDTLSSVTGLGVNGYVLVYNSTLKKSVWTNPTGFGTNFWSRSGTTLSPATSGDNILTTGNITADSLKRTGGLSTEFLKGDGSITTLGTSSISNGGTTNGLSYSNGNYRLHKVTSTTGGVFTSGTDTIGGLKNFYDNIILGKTGGTGSVSFKRNSDGSTASLIEQSGDNTLKLTSSGGTKQVDIASDAVNVYGVIKFPTSTSTLAAGDMGYNSTYGQYIRGKTGSNDDWTVFAAIGGYLMHNPTGTNTLSIGSLAGTGTRMVVANNLGDLSTQAIPGGGGGAVTGVAVANANGFTGTSDGNATVPTLTLSTTVTGITKGNGSALSAAVDGTDYISPTTSVSTTAPIASWTQNNTTDGFGLKILAQGSSANRYAFSLQNLAETQTYLHVPTETGKLGSVVIGSKVPYTGLSSRGLTVNGDTYSSIGLNINDTNKGYISGYSDGILLQSVGKLVLNNNTGNVLVGTTTDDGVNKVQISGNIVASNLSGTNTGDQTTITGNAGTATALQTARNIQGVSFNGTADINPINGTGFVKATGTALSYDNTSYAPLNSPTFTGTVSGITAAMVGAPSGSGTSTGTNTGDQTITLTGAVTGSGTGSFATTLASGIDATKLADGTVTSTELQYINTLSSNAQNQLDAKAPLASPTFTGTPSLPTGTTGVTQTAGDNSTKLATTAYVDRLGGGTVASGTYTPTLTNGVNVSSSTPGTGIYQRIGNVVSGYVDFVATGSASLLGEVGVSLPIASDFSAVTDVFGSLGIPRDTESTTTPSIPALNADITNNRFSVVPSLVSGTPLTYRFQFTYLVK